MQRSAWVVAGLMLVGCGGRSLADGPGTGSAGQGASENGGATAVGGAGGGVGACVGDPAEGSASPVTFVFTSNQPLWLRLDCSLEYSVSRECDGELKQISTGAFCEQECGSDSMGCAACAPCASGAVQVAPNVTTSVFWDGYAYANSTALGGGNCFIRSPARSGMYQVSTTAFLSQEDALQNQNGYPHTTRFVVIPASSNVVTVDLSFTGL